MSDAKTRADAWESCLTDEQQRSLYAWSRTPVDDGSDTPRRPTYEMAVASINGDFARNIRTFEHSNIQTISAPSRAAWFRFLARQRKVDAIQQLTRIEAARDWGREVAEAAGMDPSELAAAFRAKAMDAMMDDDPKAVSAYSAAAAAIWDRAQKERELALKDRAQQTKEADLELAQRKFEDEQTRRTAAEARADKAEQIAKALQEKVKELEKALKDAGKVNVVDTSKVMDELDKLLGMKK